MMACDKGFYADGTSALKYDNPVYGIDPVISQNGFRLLPDSVAMHDERLVPVDLGCSLRLSFAGVLDSLGFKEMVSELKSGSISGSEFGRMPKGVAFMSIIAGLVLSLVVILM